MSERGQEIIAALQAGMNVRHQREQAEHNKELLKMQIDAHKLAANKMKLDMARQAWEDQTRHSEMQYKMGQQALGVGPVSTVSAPGVGAIPAFGSIPNRPIPFPAPPTSEGVPSGPPSSFTPPTMMQLQLAEQLRKRQDLALAVERARGIAEAEFPYKQPLPVAGRDIPLPEPVAKQRQELNAPQPPALLPPDQEAQRIRIAKAGQHPTFRFINTVDEQGNPIQKAVPVQPGQEYQMAPTADMRNKQVARNKTLASVNAIESLSKEVINLKGVAQRAKAIGSSIEAALGNNPKYRTYQDARKALAGNLAVLQQGSRPSDADITAVWLPLVPDVFNDTNESAKMKWDLIKISSGMPVASPEPTPTGSSKNPYR